MDFSKIKQFVKQNGDKFIFLENGEPEMVMMSFEEYEKLAGSNGFTNSAHIKPNVFQDGRFKARYNVEFADLGDADWEETEFISTPGGEAAGLPVRLEDIRLEDLPL